MLDILPVSHLLLCVLLIILSFSCKDKESDGFLSNSSTPTNTNKDKDSGNSANESPAPDILSRKAILNDNLSLLPYIQTIDNKNFEIDWGDKMRNHYSEKFLMAHKPMIPPDRLFVSPILLNLLSDLTERVVHILEALDITYWAIGGTQLSAIRFSSFMPWDDDADLAVMIEELIDKQTDFTDTLSRHGLSLAWRRCLNEYPDNSHCKVRYTPDEKLNRISHLHPDMVQKEVEALTNTLHVDVDLFPFISKGSRYIHADPYWQKAYHDHFGNELGDEYSDIFPLKRLYLNNFTLNGMNNPDKLNRGWYGGGDILYKFHMTNHLNAKYNPIVIENIKDYPAFLELIDDYLRFCFGDKYQGMPSPLSSILLEKQE